MQAVFVHAGQGVVTIQLLCGHLSSHHKLFKGNLFKQKLVLNPLHQLCSVTLYKTACDITRSVNYLLDVNVL